MCAMPLVLSRDISWNKGVFCLDQPRSIVWELCKIMLSWLLTLMCSSHPLLQGLLICSNELFCCLLINPFVAF